VLAAGATAAFAVNALMYLPLIFAFFLWRREHVPARLPPERLHRAIISGARYALHSPPIRIVLIRAVTLGLAAASISALTPLVARNLLAGNASTFGLLLGANGVGAVVGALVVSEVRNRLKAEHAVRLCAIVASVMIVVIALSKSVIITSLALAVAGAAYMLNIALLNVGVQLSAPRWVTARAIAWFQASLTGGIAIGAWVWGVVASDWGVSTALIASGITLLLSPLIGLVLPTSKWSRSPMSRRSHSRSPRAAARSSSKSIIE
jgi:predicted MFS family arabinose efflux permease